MPCLTLFCCPMSFARKYMLWMHWPETERSYNELYMYMAGMRVFYQISGFSRAEIFLGKRMKMVTFQKSCFIPTLVVSDSSKNAQNPQFFSDIPRWIWLSSICNFLSCFSGFYFKGHAHLWHRQCIYCSQKLWLYMKYDMYYNCTGVMFPKIGCAHVQSF